MRYSYSTLAKFEACPRMFEYSEELRLQPRAFGGTALSVGTAVHHGIARMYAGLPKADAISESVALYTAETEGYVDLEAIRKVDEGRLQTEACLQEYRWVSHDFDHIEAIEQEWEAPLAGVIYSGRIDRMVRVGDRHYIHDTKTSGLRMHDTIKIQRLRMQYPGYAWLGMQQGHTIAGVIVDIITKPRVYYKKDGSFSSMSPAEFHRETIATPDWRIQEFTEWATGVIARIQSTPRTMNTASCFNYNKACPFMALCEAHPRFRPGIMESLFEPRPEEEVP